MPTDMWPTCGIPLLLRNQHGRRSCIITDIIDVPPACNRGISWCCFVPFKGRHHPNAFSQREIQDDVFRPTSSGRGAFAACFNSSSYLAMRAGSTWTSGGASAGAATNSRDWLLRPVNMLPENETGVTHPTSFLASQRNGFSKLYCSGQHACFRGTASYPEMIEDVQNTRSSAQGARVHVW
jgi:hypothetical protein